MAPFFLPFFKQKQTRLFEMCVCECVCGGHSQNKTKTSAAHMQLKQGFVL